MCAVDLPSYCGTGSTLGLYLLPLCLRDKIQEGGFNLDSTTIIPEALCKEVGTHTKGFIGRAVPESCID